MVAPLEHDFKTSHRCSKKTDILSIQIDNGSVALKIYLMMYLESFENLKWKVSVKNEVETKPTILGCKLYDVSLIIAISR